MYGILKNHLWLFFVFLPQVAQACPACLTSDTEGLINQRVWVIGIMGLFPVVLACVIGFKIYQICHSDSQKIIKNSGG